MAKVWKLEDNLKFETSYHRIVAIGGVKFTNIGKSINANTKHGKGKEHVCSTQQTYKLFHEF